jgi:hypothetical protein
MLCTPNLTAKRFALAGTVVPAMWRRSADQISEGRYGSRWRS